MCANGFVSIRFHLCVRQDLVVLIQSKVYVSKRASNLSTSVAHNCQFASCRSHRPPKFSRFIIYLSFSFWFICFHLSVRQRRGALNKASNNAIIALVAKMIYVFSFSHSLSLFLFFFFYYDYCMCVDHSFSSQAKPFTVLSYFLFLK